MGGLRASQAGGDFWLQVSEPTPTWLAGLRAELSKEEPRDLE